MRRADWQRRFNEAVDTASLIPFTWGQHDCVMFVAFVVDRMTDSSYVKDIRKNYAYADEFAATNVIQSSGGLLKLCKQWLGEPMPVNHAMPGDVVLMRNDGRVLLAIVEGHQALAASEKGIVPIPMRDAVCAWRIK
jgi:hypothetical protein